jgi:hypothetical protein
VDAPVAAELGHQEHRLTLCEVLAVLAHTTGDVRSAAPVATPNGFLTRTSDTRAGGTAAGCVGGSGTRGHADETRPGRPDTVPPPDI